MRTNLFTLIEVPYFLGKALLHLLLGGGGEADLRAKTSCSIVSLLDSSSSKYAKTFTKTDNISRTTKGANEKISLNIEKPN